MAGTVLQLLSCFTALWPVPTVTRCVDQARDNSKRRGGICPQIVLHPSVEIRLPSLSSVGRK